MMQDVFQEVLPALEGVAEVVAPDEYLALLTAINEQLTVLNSVTVDILAWIVWAVSIAVASVVAYFICKPIFYFIGR